MSPEDSLVLTSDIKKSYTRWDTKNALFNGLETMTRKNAWQNEIAALARNLDETTIPLRPSLKAISLKQLLFWCCLIESRKICLVFLLILYYFVFYIVYTSINIDCKSRNKAKQKRNYNYISWLCFHYHILATIFLSSIHL